MPEQNAVLDNPGEGFGDLEAELLNETQDQDEGAADPDTDATDPKGQSDDEEKGQAGEAEKWRKSYENLRSYTDRTITRTKAIELENARLKAERDMLASMKAEAREQSGLSQAEFEKQWKEKLAEDPSSAIDFFRGVAGELKTSIQQEYEGKISALSARLADLDPEYRENKPVIDQYMQDFGVDRETAKKIAAKLSPGKPRRAAIPGAVVNGRAEPGGTPKARVRLSKQLESFVAQQNRLLGFSDKESKDVMESVVAGVSK
jgi:hypothetical protein